jgi:hypothetical protein
MSGFAGTEHAVRTQYSSFIMNIILSCVHPTPYEDNKS